MKELTNKSEVVKQIENKFGQRIEIILYDLYIKKDISANKIAKILGVQNNIIIKWLSRMELKDKFNIKRFDELLNQ